MNMYMDVHVDVNVGVYADVDCTWMCMLALMLIRM